MQTLKTVRLNFALARRDRVCSASLRDWRSASRAYMRRWWQPMRSANLVPEELVHRVIVRESKYQPHLIGRGGTIGLMQIKLADRAGHRLHRLPPRACATPPPISNTASNTSPAPIAPPTATSTEPCVISRAGILRRKAPARQAPESGEARRRECTAEGARQAGCAGNGRSRSPRTGRKIADRGGPQATRVALRAEPEASFDGGPRQGTVPRCVPVYRSFARGHSVLAYTLTRSAHPLTLERVPRGAPKEELRYRTLGPRHQGESPGPR